MSAGGSISQPVGAMGSTGYLIYDTNTPGVIGPAVVNAYTTLSIPAYWRAVAFLSENLASFPKTVRKANVDVSGHRVTKLMARKPNGYQSASLFWRTLFFHFAHYRNAFAEVERDTQFNPVALHNRLPEMVAPFRYYDESGQVSQWYWIGGYKARVVPAADMIHFSGLSYDGIGGFNPIWVLAETFERSRLLDRYVTRFLTKGSMVRGSVEIPGDVNKDKQQQIADTIRSHFAGADAERDVLILSGGATLNNKTLTPQDSQLSKQFEIAIKQIAQITGVHPHFLYDDSEGKYNANPTQAADDVVKWTFRPLIEACESELSLKLLAETETDAGLCVHLDAECITRGDRQMQSTIVTQQKQAGVISGNEARAEIGYPPSKDPSADQLKVSGDTSPGGTKPPPPDPEAKSEGS